MEGAAQLMTAEEADEWGRALTEEGITAYSVIVAPWLAGMDPLPPRAYMLKVETVE